MSFNKLVQYGGQTLTKNCKHKSVNIFVMLLIVIIVLLVRTAIVCMGYNMLMPKFIQTLGNSPNNIINFRELQYNEALILVIAVQCLVGV